MRRVMAAFGQALASQLHPRMLALLVLPFLVALVFWIAIAWWVWDPLNDWLRSTLFGTERSGVAAGWLSLVGLAGVGAGFTAAVAMLLLAPLMFAAALMAMAVLAMPLVLRHLGQTRYRAVAREGGDALVPSLRTAFNALVMFVIGYLVTLPLWLVPLAGLLVPWFWWSWLAARVMRFDSLVEHASPAERASLIARYRGQYLLLALLISILNYIPPLFLITPVLSALAFGHFSLTALRDHRLANAPPSESAVRALTGQPG